MRLLLKMHVLRRVAVLALLALGANGARAAVLAEDRADLMYHRYQGGGITVDESPLGGARFRLAIP